MTALNPLHAEVLHRALTTLAEIGAVADTIRADDFIVVVRGSRISVFTDRSEEHHDNLDAFAAAYGLADKVLTAALPLGTAYWAAYPTTGEVMLSSWDGDPVDMHRLAEGRVYGSEAAAWAAVNAGALKVGHD